MKKFLLLTSFPLVFEAASFAQLPVDTNTTILIDSLPLQDTTFQEDPFSSFQPVDSFSPSPRLGSGWVMKTGISFSSSEFSWQILTHHNYFSFNSNPEILPASDVKKRNGKELLFYLLVFLLIVFAAIKKIFPKYFNDLFRLFFRTTLKQRQIREQLMQTAIPSLLLNGFFVISGGLYLAFILQHYNLNPVNNFWLLFLYCIIGLSTAYFIKFIGLKISGWLFNMKETADSYIFIVFIVNKMIGILLLPFLILIAFALGEVYYVGITVSFFLVAALVAYRFILTYAAVRNQVKVNLFHFFLYLCAFEIAPLLLVYKGLLLFFGITA